MSSNYQVIQIGDAILYHGDAMEVLPALDVEADMLCMDPPYKLTSRGGNPNGQKRMSGKFNLKEYNNDGNIVDCNIDWQDFMPLCYEALRNNSHAYIMCNDKNIHKMLNSAQWVVGSPPKGFIEILMALVGTVSNDERKPLIRKLLEALDGKREGFKFHNLLVWEKDNATPNRWYMKNCEFTGFFYKGLAKYINDMGAKQLLYVPQEPYGNHPTPKPVMLMRHYIEQSTKPGEIVLDPFMGSGSTAIAALKAGRKFIGIEKNKEYFDMCVDRVNKFYSSAQQGVFI